VIVEDLVVKVPDDEIHEPGAWHWEAVRRHEPAVSVVDITVEQVTDAFAGVEGGRRDAGQLE
jgi:hypothetical protein